MIKKISRIKHKSNTGWLSELVSMKYDDEPFNCIHTYIVSIKPKCKRANHYHKKKKEWLSICYGKIKILLEDVNIKEKEILILDSETDKHEIIFIPPYVAHSVTNISNSDSVIIIFSTMCENEEDTISYEVKG